MSHNCRSYVGLALLLLIQVELLALKADARCPRPDDLANGAIMQRRNLLRFRCYANYVLMGKSVFTCGTGRLNGERPFCARAGCTQPPAPENGAVEMQRGLAAVLVCDEEFVVAGNALAYCNGNQWDRTLGVCRHRNHSQSHACDFESEDLCGWVPQVALIQPWRRVATVNHFHSYRTGPRHDHTLQNAYGGHYMLMETSPFAVGAHHFVSPIYPRELSLKTACCFRFHYFMYGTDVGDLMVFVKPQELSVEDMWRKLQNKYLKFKVSGNQGNQWLEHTIIIDEMPQNFQVVFTATDASGQFGDIAIDDVRLMTGSECGGGGFTTSTEPPVRETLEPVVYDMMNCSQRCGQSAPIDDELRPDGKLIKACGCDDQCVEQENCCLDYFAICLEDATTDPAMQPAAANTTATKPTTTTTTTTTTRTTTTTTTTTTPKPTTKRRTTASTTTSTTTLPTSTTKRKTPPPTRRTTTTTTTTTPAPTTPITTTTTTTTSTARAKTAQPTQPHQTRFTWPVLPDDLKGDADRQSGSNPVRFMLYFMLAIMLVLITCSVLYRMKRTKGATDEKAVIFQTTYAKLKKAAVSRLTRSGRGEGSAPLVAENGDDSDVQFEEMGVDIRNVSEL